MSPHTPITNPVESYYSEAGALLLSFQEHMMAWQKEAVRVFLAQAFVCQSGALTAMRAAVQAPQLTGHDPQLQRFVGLADMWLRLAMELQAALFHASSPSLVEPAEDADPTAMERRAKSVVINFPERRAA